MDDELPPSATPLGPEDRAGLLVDASTRGELDEFEALNIADAVQWANSNTKFRNEILTVTGLRRLHAHMLGDTWAWAGKFRTAETNIGIPFQQISEKIQALCGDVAFWVENATYAWPELAVRFHHRLVKIHPFPNGNGRHARLAANLLLRFNAMTPLPWGGSMATLEKQGLARNEYLIALRLADDGDLERLVTFAQSTAS